MKYPLASYIFLMLAITFGVIANGYFLKVSSGFTKIIPTAGGIFTILLAYFFLAKSIQNIPIGFTYATYGGLTIIGATFIGYLKFNQAPNLFSIIGICLIVIGVILVNYFGSIK